MIYTFYSYKGGVGRTMALANVAEFFYQAGFKVLMVDWDLEAPGLERYFPSIDLKETVDKPGLMDMLLRYKQQMAQELDEDAHLELESPVQYVIDIYPGRSGTGKLWLLTAGRRSRPHFADYAKAVLAFDWQDFYESWEGELYFDWLREQFENVADVVLIDSRTGITEMGGVCTYQLADTVVIFCASNQQNLDGTYEMARNFTDPKVQSLRRGRSLNVLIIPARIERAESELLDEFQRKFVNLVTDFMPFTEGIDIGQLWRLGIPYIPKYAFTEAVAIRESGRASAEDMIEAFVLLANVMLNLARIKSAQKQVSVHTDHQKAEGMVTPPAQLFIAYKRDVDLDQKLAHYLHDFLTAQGHDVFMDHTMRTGAEWLEQIDRRIKASDFLVVLLSKESAHSEMVEAEVRRADEYRKRQGHPHTLPVRIAYEGPLPYSIDAFLDPLQYVLWQSEADNDLVAKDILAAIEGQLPIREPIQLRSVVGKTILSEDGRVVTDAETMYPPLPEFDPRFLEELEAPGGAVKLRSKFYVERDADARLKREMVKPGTTTTIRAARQTGKSSLLTRGLHYARRSGASFVALDMQRVDRDQLEVADVFLHFLAEFIVRKLRLDVAEVDNLWRGSLGPQDKLTYLMEDYILPECDAPLVLALDEADRLLGTDFYKDFFALIRSWHNSRVLDERWNGLNVVLVISTEPYLLIDDVTQSPFNVGLKLYLEDFDEAQVRDLNRRHGSPVGEGDFPQLMKLLNGHPYLTRKALYTLVTSQLTWTDLMRVAPKDHGPFGDHLRHHHWLLHDEPHLRETLKQVIHQGRCTDEIAFFRLLRAGLVKGSGDVRKCRCDLYRMYFEDKL